MLLGWLALRAGLCLGNASDSRIEQRQGFKDYRVSRAFVTL
jgi:hypothetical protein